MKLWMRLGVTIDVTEEEVKKILFTDNCNETEDLMVRILKERGCTVDGNTYIPESSANETLQKIMPKAFGLHHRPYQGEPEWDFPLFRMIPEKVDIPAAENTPAVNSTSVDLYYGYRSDSYGLAIEACLVDHEENLSDSDMDNLTREFARQLSVDNPDGNDEEVSSWPNYNDVTFGVDLLDGISLPKKTVQRLKAAGVEEWTGRTGLIDFDYDGTHYALTADEIEAAYRYQERQYRLQDAKRHLDMLVFGCDDFADFAPQEDVAKEKACFQDTYGLTYEEASTQEMLESYLEHFADRFDCNVDENTTWENAIAGAIQDEMNAKAWVADLKKMKGADLND